MRMNAFRKEPIADQKMAEYKRTLPGKDNWRSQIWWLHESKSCFVNPFNVTAAGDGCPVCQPFVTT